MRALFPLFLFGVLWPDLHFQPSTATDRAVYDAVLSSTMGQMILRQRSAGSADRTATVLALTQTAPLCPDAVTFDRALGCFQAKYIQAVDAAFVLDEYPGQILPRLQPLRFEGKLDTGTRTELTQSFRERNRASQRFEGSDLNGLLAVSPSDFQRVYESRPTAGVVRFSAPGYSNDGHSLVYGSYVCGGLCGYSWLFLLKQEGNSWRVVANEVLGVS